jgi:hypothetical protein
MNDPKLIAAAPEMLAILEQAKAAMDVLYAANRQSEHGRQSCLEAMGDAACDPLDRAYNAIEEFLIDLKEEK